MDEMLGEIAINPPIPIFICISQGASRHLAFDADMIKLVVHGLQTANSIPETVPIGQLGKRHT
jgi:hypothetical protein